MEKKTRGLQTKDLTYVAVCAVLMAVCSWISIPATVPFTLQTFAVFCSLGLLGGRRGTAAILVYLLLGALGVPVFAGFSGGIGILFLLSIVMSIVAAATVPAWSENLVYLEDSQAADFMAKTFRWVSVWTVLLAVGEAVGIYYRIKTLKH